jgi:hypothetical protein
MGVFDTITQGLTDAYTKAKTAIQGPAQQAANTTGVPNLTPPGVASEAPGTTTTGGKRGSRKTRRVKKSKKTHRRRKH